MVRPGLSRSSFSTKSSYQQPSTTGSCAATFDVCAVISFPLSKIAVEAVGHAERRVGEDGRRHLAEVRGDLQREPDVGPDIAIQVSARRDLDQHRPLLAQLEDRSLGEVEHALALLA